MKIGIFASAQPVGERYELAVQMLGEALAKAGHSMIFGGCDLGLMHACAEGFAKGGGALVGVVPERFKSMPAHPQCGQVILTPDMAARKAKMAQLAEGFVVLPGGIGTMDEFFTVWVQRDIGEIGGPIVLFDPFGLYDELFDFLAKLQQEGFVTEEAMTHLRRCATAEEVLEALGA